MKNTSYSLSILFIGSQEEAYQFAEVAYSKIESVLSLGKYPIFEVDPSRFPIADIVAARVGKLSMDRFVKNDYMVLPSISFSLDLRCPVREMVTKMSRRRRRDLARLEKYNYSYVVCRNDEKSFDFFYQKMYYSYTTKRFGKAALLRSYLTTKSCYQNNGGIIFVKKGDKPVAGILFQIRGRTLCALSLGVYEGKKDLLKALVGQAALFFLIEWAQMKGMTILNYGYTMPFLANGNFQYKKEWGMFVERKTDETYCIFKPNLLSKGSLSFLFQNPFIFSDKGLMKGAVFVSRSVTKTELEQISYDHLLPRLDSLVVVSCGNNDTGSMSKSEMRARPMKGSDAFSGPLSSACLLLQKQGLNVKIHEVSPFQNPRCRQLRVGQLSKFSIARIRWLEVFHARVQPARAIDVTVDTGKVTGVNKL